MARGKRRAALIAVIAAALVSGGTATALALTGGESRANVRTEVVGRGTVHEVVEAPGEVVARASVTVTAPASGTIAQLRVRDGAKVRAGDVLLRIDSPQAQQRLKQAQDADAQLASSAPAPAQVGPGPATQREIDNAQAAAEKGFAQARAAADKIPDAAARAQALAAVTSAEAQYAAAQQAATEALRQVEQGAGSLTNAVAAMVNAQRLQTRAAVTVAQQAVDSLVVRAPVAGTVSLGATSSGGSGLDAALSQLPGGLADQATQLLGSTSAGSGAGAAGGSGATPTLAEGLPVTSGSGLLTITDDSDVSLSAQVDETDVLLVKRGVRADAELDAVPGAAYQAVVTSVEANPASSSSGSVSYRVRLRLGPGQLPDGGAAPMPRAGMSAVVDLRVRTATNAVSVPVSAVFRVGARDAVWVVESGRAHQRVVTLGAQGEDSVQVVDGVSTGETVVVSGADRLHEGQAVT